MKRQSEMQISFHNTIFRYFMALVYVSGILASSASGQQIILNSGAYLNCTGANIVVNGKIDNSGSITNSAAGSTIKIGGNFSNTGSFTGTGNTITFNGTSAQSIEGTSLTTFNNIIIDNTAGVTLSSDATVIVSDTLTINSGKKIEIAPGKQLTVFGTFINNAGESGFVLGSDVTGTASLIHNTDSVPATVNLYISGSAEAWHFMSSPISAQSITGEWIPSGTYGNGTGYDLYVWDEASSCWIYKLNTTTPVNWNTVHPGGNFVAGRGYLYSFQADNPTKQFSGNLNNGTVSIALTYSGTDLNLKGFNLVGNPFPSSADWQAASGWTRSNLESSGSGFDMWIWNPSAANYGVVNSASGSGTNGVTRYIAPMQGFFVRAASAGDIGITNSVRIHDGAGNWLKKGEGTDINMVSIIVKSEAGKGFDEVRLLFNSKLNEPGATKLFSHVLTAPSLYLPFQGENLSVRYLTDTVDNPMVPVMFKPGMDGEYSLQFSFDQDQFETVVLEDRQHHLFQDLKTENRYKFKSSKTDDQSRFVLHFVSVENPGNIELQAPIYIAGNLLIIDLSMINRETEVMVCDIMGRPLLRKMIQGKSLHELSINSETQMLIVCLKNHNGMVCRKLIWINN